MMIAISESITVGLACSMMSRVTGTCWKNEMPRSPWSARPSHRTNWTGRGRSSPKLCRSASTCWGAASCPSSTRAGSPGVRWISRNTTTATTSRTGTRAAIRPVRYDSTSSPRTRSPGRRGFDPGRPGRRCAAAGSGPLLHRRDVPGDQPVARAESLGRHRFGGEDHRVKFPGTHKRSLLVPEGLELAPQLNPRTLIGGLVELVEQLVLLRGVPPAGIRGVEDGDQRRIGDEPVARREQIVVGWLRPVVEHTRPLQHLHVHLESDLLELGDRHRRALEHVVVLLGS